MKKMCSVVLVLLVSTILFGCGIKEKIEQEASEAITEKVLEKSSGGEVDVDIDGENFAITGEDGEKIEIGATDWPDDEFFKDIPKLDAGSIASTIASDTGTMLVVNDVDADTFSSYYEDIKSAFSQNPVEANYEGLITYSASNENGITISINYTTEDGSVVISASKTTE
jgi:hypothetical protein